MYYTKFLNSKQCVKEIEIVSILTCVYVSWCVQYIGVKPLQSQKTDHVYPQFLSGPILASEN